MERSYSNRHKNMMSEHGHLSNHNQNASISSHGAKGCNNATVEQVQGQTICSSIVEVSDGKAKPVPRRLLLTSTHVVIQKNVTKEGDNDADSNRPTHGSVSDRGFSGEGSFDSATFLDTDSPPPENNKREVTLNRMDGPLGISVRGGAEHQLPLIISRLTPGSPAATCKQMYIGDAIIALNGVKITRMDHDEAVDYLNSCGPMVTLKLKHLSAAKPFLSPTQQQNLLETNLTQWEATEDGALGNEQWETEKQVPLLFAVLSRYIGGTDRLRCNAFEVRDSTANSTTGVIHCGDPYALTSWVKCVSDAILGLNNMQIKLWSQETQSEIFYVGWIWEGTTSEGRSPTLDAMMRSPSLTLQLGLNQSWLLWKPKILAIRGENLYYMEYPPGVGSDWGDCSQVHGVMTTLLRVLSSSGEHLDERQHCFTLQMATMNDGFPPNCGSRPQPITMYLSTETRQELIKVETAWTKAVTAAVKAAKKCSYPVWWGGKPCRLEMDFSKASFNLFRASSKPSPPLWTRHFSALKGSSDDSRTRLTLKFHGDFPPETMECRDLHRILFTIHSFLLAKVIH